MRYPDVPHTFSVPLFVRIWNEWQDWLNGIPPTREWRGRGSVNPALLRAFVALSNARARAESEHVQAAQERAGANNRGNRR